MQGGSSREGAIMGTALMFQIICNLKLDLELSRYVVALGGRDTGYRVGDARRWKWLRALTYYTRSRLDCRRRVDLVH
ncbi:unnamed protein product [Timema podura]|uniref:Uncharacterized protein n=1 Tax=Timema podura TaxID=61482 RepID=A0ABN7NN05_TIMPD|nr:unnamed protein product [Timema podura]